MQINTERDLGLVIRERRRSLGLDQDQLATRAGVSRQWVVEIEKGKPRAEVGLVLRALRVLGLELRAEAPPADVGGQRSPLDAVDIDDLIDRARERDPPS